MMGAYMAIEAEQEKQQFSDCCTIDIAVAAFTIAQGKPVLHA